MFKDRSEELARLEAELLAEEAPEEEYDEYDEYDLPEEDPLPEPDPWLYEDTRSGSHSGAYQNYSNAYGKNLRNYASGYRAYNSDDTDTDLEDYSEEVRRGRKSTGCLTAVAVLLAVALVAVLGIWFAWERGLL